MNKSDFRTLFRQGQWPPFFRLTQPLKCVKVDFDYAKTRKALDPHWNGYDIPNGHDIIEEDCDLAIANLVTSQHYAQPHKHRILLDLDYGASILTLAGVTRLRLSCRPAPIAVMSIEQQMQAMFLACGLIKPNSTNTPKLTLLDAGAGILEIDIQHDFYFGQSSTQGHYHLIIGHDLPWMQYTELLNTLSTVGAIQRGYAKASIKRGYAALRPPWVHKQK